MEIAKTIQEYRRKRGYTQERLAELVGVSAPAVSKWETGASLPDVTLLVPIARALGITPDGLLGFRASLTDGEVDAFEQACGEVFAREGYDAGLARCEAMLREYPNCPYLRFRAAALCQRNLIALPEPEEERLRREFARFREWLRQVYDGGDSRLRAAAAVSLASYALIDGELERAETLLSELPRAESDPDELYPLLYLKKGERERAVKRLEERAYKSGGEAVRALNLLATIALEDGSREQALAYSRAAAALVKALALRDVSGCAAYLQLLCRNGETEEAAAEAEAYLNRLATLGESGHPFLSRLGLRIYPEQLRAVQRAFLSGFETEETFAVLREDPRVRAALERLRREVSREPS